MSTTPPRSVDALARAEGLLEQANADRARLKHELEQALLTVDALKLLLDRAADALEIAANALPEDRSAREVVAELRKAATRGAPATCPHDAFATPATCRKCWALAGKVIEP